MDGDYFLTIAELAVALAGFGSLTPMILAVLPVDLGRFALPEDLVWGAPAVLFVVAAPYLHIAPVR